MTRSAVPTARRAAKSRTMERLGRIGLAAHGGVYVLFGALALLLALGRHSGETDQRGAMQNLARNPAGAIVVWVLAFGLFAYAAWRFSEVAFGVTGKEDKPSERAKSAARGLAYLLLGITAVKIAAHIGAGSQAAQQEFFTGKAMQYTGGRWVVGIVGVGIVAIGGLLTYQGVKRSFEENLDKSAMTEQQRKVVMGLGAFGTTARGVVVALAGVFVVVAAITADPKEAGGLDRALRELQDAPAGPFLLGLVAIGLIAFGLFGFAEAKWRKF